MHTLYCTCTGTVLMLHLFILTNFQPTSQPVNLSCKLAAFLCLLTGNLASCCRTQRRCGMWQSSASGWSYLPGPSPCPDSLTANNNRRQRHCSHFYNNVPCLQENRKKNRKTHKSKFKNVYINIEVVTKSG